MVATAACDHYYDCPYTSGYCRCNEYSHSGTNTTYPGFCPCDNYTTIAIGNIEPEPVKKAAPIVFNSVYGRIRKRLWIHKIFIVLPGQIRAPPY